MKHTFEKWLKYISENKIVIRDGVASLKESRTRQPKTSSQKGVYYDKGKGKWFFIMERYGVRTCSKAYLTESEAIEAQSIYSL